MSARNYLKDRRCGTCGEIVHGKAGKLKRHAKDHEVQLRQAAMEAVLAKLREPAIGLDEAKAS